MGDVVDFVHDIASVGANERRPYGCVSGRHLCFEVCRELVSAASTDNIESDSMRFAIGFDESKHVVFLARKSGGDEMSKCGIRLFTHCSAHSVFIIRHASANFAAK
jgi:hypothetical protein